MEGAREGGGEAVEGARGAMSRRRELEKEGLRTRPSGISSDVEGGLVASYTHVFGNVRGCP